VVFFSGSCAPKNLCFAELSRLCDGLLASVEDLSGILGWKMIQDTNTQYHPWIRYIYPHERLICMVNVGKYTIHGLFGYHSLVFVAGDFLVSTTVNYHVG